MPECKLCLKDSVLKNSHIIPEFMYQNLYDANPKRFYALNVNLDNTEKSRIKIEQKGIRECLLCGNCEGLLSKYEKYAAETIYAKNKKNKAKIVKSIRTDDLQYSTHEFKGFSYKDFKIFLLSILWRMIISKSFATPYVDIGLVEKLRNAILEETPLKYDDLGCFLKLIKYLNGKTAKGINLQPFLRKGENSIVLDTFIDGFLYSFYLNSGEIEEDEKAFFLKENGTMKILEYPLLRDKELFNRVNSIFDLYKTKKKQENLFSNG